jgi:hypothetical protein
MRKKLLAAVAAALVAAGPAAQAHDRSGAYIAGAAAGLAIGATIISRPPVAYYAPPPVAYVPLQPPAYVPLQPPAYLAQPFANVPPVVFGPPPVVTYYPPPAVFYRPAPVYYGPPRGYYAPPGHYNPGYGYRSHYRH